MNHWTGMIDSAESFLALIQQSPPNAYAYWERMEGCHLQKMGNFSLTLAYVQSCDHGRIFSDEFELAWWQESHGRISVRFIAMNLLQSFNSVAWDEMIVLEETAKTEQLLVGEWNETAWSEARIPTPQMYPIENGSAEKNRVTIMTEYYYLGQSNTVIGRFKTVAHATWIVE